ncbi:hypothetical protein KM043_006732 [Ampulex compressa]|nr:hypothetical protein KM043_006732 [Ampulex compressa]
MDSGFRVEASRGEKSGHAVDGARSRVPGPEVIISTLAPRHRAVEHIAIAEETRESRGGRCGAITSIEGHVSGQRPTGRNVAARVKPKRIKTIVLKAGCVKVRAIASIRLKTERVVSRLRSFLW